MNIELNEKPIQPFKILIVEDDPSSIFLAETYLKAHFKVHSVTNGYDALIMIEKTKFDIVLMDINLDDPAMDGPKTMRTIRYNRKYNHIKIIAVTAASGSREWYLKQGFDGHCLKPLFENGIIEEINKQLLKPFTHSNYYCL
ncbi:MAG: response regulator [Bacteroidota bacterium]|nr:response regulator [Bacteroidota bacterium]MDP3144951.1 response regulator [Bacteroidota bacterium]MDP3557036.1 response regulator [Bacteroidota bacterium]